VAVDVDDSLMDASGMANAEKSGAADGDVAGRTLSDGSAESDGRIEGDRTPETAASSAIACTACCVDILVDGCGVVAAPVDPSRARRSCSAMNEESPHFHHS